MESELEKKIGVDVWLADKWKKYGEWIGNKLVLRFG